MVDVIVRRWAGALAVLAGLLVALAAQVASPLASPPLYDGVVVVQPYVWVNPPPGQPGGATGSSLHLQMDGHTVPLVVVATPEQPAQAQILATRGSLVVPPTAKSIDASITPLDPAIHAGASGAAQILGNVYRITVVDQDGAPATAPASAMVSVVLRAPSTEPGAQLGLLDGNAWRPLKSEAGFGSTYITVVTGFGDFAVIVPGVAPSAAAASGQGAPAGGSGAAASPAPGVVPGAGAAGGSEGPASGMVVAAIALIGLLVLFAAVSIRSGSGAPRQRR